jgi:LemA protein
MRLGRILLLILGVVVLTLFAVGGCFYRGYNRAVRLDEKVDAQWSLVENVIKRRFDLIPNLVETVKGVAAQEEKIFIGVAEARKAYTNARSVDQKAQAAGLLEGAMMRVLALRESYPALRSNESFLRLQDQIEGTENRIAVERRRYNEQVRQLNTYRRELLGRFFTSLAGVDEAEYFELPEGQGETPEVDFSDLKTGQQPSPEADTAPAAAPAAQ